MNRQEQFINSIAKYVMELAPLYGIKVCSPIIAQACLESGWGKSSLAYKYHNYFGMKCGSAWKGKSVNLRTKEEYTKGVYTDIRDNFRVYDSIRDGIKGYFEFISTRRYQNLKGIRDPKTYLETIKADGYATSFTYVSKLMSIINKYNLTRFDSSGYVVPKIPHTTKKWINNNYEPKTENGRKVMTKYAFSALTMDFLDKYPYSEELYTKMLGAKNDMNLNIRTIKYIMQYKYADDILKKLAQ